MAQKSFGLTFALVFGANEALGLDFKGFGGQPDGKDDSSVRAAPRHFGDPLLLSSFVAEDPCSTLATKEFEKVVSVVPLLEGVDHLVLPQKFGEADHETTEEENEMPGQKRTSYGNGW